MSEPLIRRINREQMCWRAVDVEPLIGEDHVARAIWDLVGGLRLDGFYEGIECSEEEGGRPAYDPRLLISLWIYAYSQGIGSAREVARRCEWEPALQWLTGCETVNYHTLSSFRVEYRVELDELFTQVLGRMSAEGLITLEQVVQDGTKIKAQAASDSFQGEAKIAEHLERARRRVREMGDPDQEEGPGRVEPAQRRARRERQQRLEQGLEELQKLRPRKPRARVSVSEPEARRMRQADGGIAPNYNLQISADAAQSLIVDVQVTQAAMTANNSRPQSDASPPVWAASRDRCWPTQTSPIAAASRRWRNWRSTLSAVCARAARKKTTPAPGALRPPSSSTTKSTTTTFVRGTSPCATKAGTNTSPETFSTATKRGPRTVRTVRSSHNAVPAISIAVGACYGRKKPRP